jgi:hypothetical protein
MCSGKDEAALPLVQHGVLPRRQQLGQGDRVDRLHQMMIEPSLHGALSVRLLAPAGQRDQDHHSAPRLLSYPVGNLIAVHLGQAHIEQDHVGPELIRQPHRFNARISWPAICSSTSKLIAEIRSSSTTRMRREAAGAVR